MILATYAIPEVAAVNGLVADRHLCMCVLCIYRFARARFTTVSVLEAAGGAGGGECASARNRVGAAGTTSSRRRARRRVSPPARERALLLRATRSTARSLRSNV